MRLLYERHRPAHVVYHTLVNRNVFVSSPSPSNTFANRIKDLVHLEQRAVAVLPRHLLFIVVAEMYVSAHKLISVAFHYLTHYRYAYIFHNHPQLHTDRLL